MKSDPVVVQLLNEVLRGELTAINQYFLHAKMLKNWGLMRLAAKEHEESIDEMKHADALTERILFLEALPNLQDIGRLMIGENVKEMLQCDLKAEQQAMVVLRKGIAHCESVQDYVTRDLFEHILDGEEDHVDWLETQLALIDRVGLQNYLQSQM
jgi:bacterioferritin